ncbi:hypothetical protein [Aquimarina sp. AU474]|nr:hypothetical protein [Aquimarina sp. AU474]
MKKLKSDLKLNLKKQTISVIEKKELNTVKGGGSRGCHERSLYITSCHVH